MTDDTPADLPGLQKRIEEERKAFNRFRDQLATYLPSSPYKEDRLTELIVRAERYGARDTAAEMATHPSRFGLPRTLEATKELEEILTNVALHGTELDYLNSKQRSHLWGAFGRLSFDDRSGSSDDFAATRFSAVGFGLPPVMIHCDATAHGLAVDSD